MDYHFYIILNLVNGKVYNGQTSKNQILDRWKDHRRYLRGGYHKNYHLQNAWNKYGEENLLFIPIDSFNCTQEEADNYEEKVRLWYSSLGLSYNLKECGSKGKPSEESRKRMSESSKGMLHSVETREKMSNSMLAVGKGQKFTAFGESKSTTEWVRDPRCIVNKSTLSCRLTRDNWDVGLTTPPKPGLLYEAFGELKTVNGWCKDFRCIVGKSTLAGRLNRYKWEPEKALTTPPLEPSWDIVNKKKDLVNE